MHKSFISSLLIHALLICSSILLLSCSKSDDQKKFEQEALRPPQNITETDEHGDIIENKEDPDDWRISPMYRGLINLGDLSEHQPPFPNPVGFNSDLYIQINQRSPDQIQALYIEKIDSLGTGSEVIYYGPDEINSTFNEKSIRASLITGSEGTNISRLYRILIYDGRWNLISYGDIQIGQSGTP